MAWIFLAASEESVLPWHPGLGRSPIVKSIDFVSPACFHEWLTGIFPSLPFGRTSQHWIPDNSKESTLSMEVFHARISVLQEMERAWLVSEADFSFKWSVSWKKHVPRSFFSRMSPPFELVDWIMSSGHFPIFGMTVAGRVYLPQKLEPRTYANDGSCWVTTPTVKNSERSVEFQKGRLPNPGEFAAMSSPTGNLWPTPRASPNENRQTKPTPSQLAGKHGMNLSTAVQLWPTPRAADAEKGIRTPNGAKAEMARERTNGVDLPTAIGGGTLNPMWVEWLMGYPLGWTALEDWATQWFHSRRKSRLKD